MRKIVTLVTANSLLLILNQCTMAVHVGDESSVIFGSLSDYARVSDGFLEGDFSYRIVSVNGGEVLRKDHSYVTWVPLALLLPGTHTLEIEKAQPGWFEPAKPKPFVIQASVESGLHYNLVKVDDGLSLQNSRVQ